MPAPSPDQLIEQAGNLATGVGKGAPRQVDLRRAVSSAYYALFHEVIAGFADRFVGAGTRGTAIYALTYRTLEHGWIGKISAKVSKGAVHKADKLHAVWPSGGFGADLIAFCGEFASMKEKRHTADYDPLHRETRTDAQQSVNGARAALERFRNAPAGERDLFFLLLAFAPRRDG